MAVEKLSKFLFGEMWVRMEIIIRALTISMVDYLHLCGVTIMIILAWECIIQRRK